MPEPHALPLAGYYRGGPTFVDTFLLLRLDADGSWIDHESFDSDFDFPAYLDAIDVVSIKRRYPRGYCLQDGQGAWRSRCGRHTRQADVPVIGVAGREVARLADALVMTSWSRDTGEFRWGEMEVMGPGRLRSIIHGDECVFVPDRRPQGDALR